MENALNMEGLKNKVEQWAIDRNLHTADPNKQMLKLGEEYGELCAGMARGDAEKVVDSIGDMFVVMTILCLQMNLYFQDCIQSSYDEIKDRKGRMVDGVFVKEEDLKPSCTLCHDKEWLAIGSGVSGLQPCPICKAKKKEMSEGAWRLHTDDIRM